MHVGVGIGRKSLAIGMETANSAPVATLAMALTDNGPAMSQAALALSAVATVSVATATTVAMVVTLDSSLTFVSAAGSGWTCNAAGQVVTCTRASAAIGAAPTVTINVTSGSATKTTSSTGTLNSTGATQATASNAASVKLVSKDATSGKRVPASATEWTNLMSIAGLATGNPSSLWLGQEASGALADTLGSATLVWNTTDGPAWQQAVSGWTRTAVTTVDGGGGEFRTTDASLPDISTTSLLVLSYANLPTTFGATERSILTLGITYGEQVAADSVPNSNPAKLGLAQVGALGVAAATATTGVHPLIVQIDVTNSVPRVITDADVTTAALHAGQTGKAVWLGGNNGSTNFSGNVGYLYTVAFYGAAAEMTTVQIKKLLQTLGWTVAW